MSWSDGRRAFLALAAAGLAGCTVRPLYGSGGAVGEGRKAVALVPIDGREGYLFREALRRRFDLNPEAAQVLRVDLVLRDRGLAITRVGDVTRFNVEGTARFALVDRATGAEVLSGTVRSVSGYSALASAFATRAAREDAEARVVADLAERVFAQVTVRGAAAPA